MSRTSKTLLRLGVPSLAAATLVAGVPAFLGTAQAAQVESLSIVQGEDTTTAAGACQAFVITGSRASGSTVGERVNVILTDAAGDATSDASFCTLPTTTNDTGDTQGNETTLTPATGTSISSGGAQTGGGSTDQSSFVLGENRTGVAANARQGQVVIGITRNEPTTTTGGPVRVRVFQDLNGNNSFDAGANEVQTQTTATFSPGGPDGSNANQDAVTQVDAEQQVEDPNGPGSTDNGFAGESRGYRVRVANALGFQAGAIQGATVAFVVTTGGTTSAPSVFGVSDNDGLVTGNITLPSTTGNSTITFFVNQSNNGAASGTNTGTTTGPDTDEPRDTIVVAVAAAQSAATVDVVPRADPDSPTAAGYQQSPAVNPRTDGTRDFTIRTDNGSAATGTAVTVVVSGGDGDEFVTFLGGGDSGRSADGSTGALDDSTSGSTTDRTVVVRVTDPDATNGDGIPAGQVLTITATVRGQAARDSETLTFVAVPADARNVDLVPDPAFTPVGQARTFTARVIDAKGNPVAGVLVTFTETGPGAFRDGSSNATATTNRNGEASIEAIALAGESGQQIITATIPSTGNRTGDAAGTGAARAGNFSDTATNNVGIASPAPTATVVPTATATPTAGTPTGGPTANPTGAACTNPTTVTLDRSVTRPGRPVKVTVRATANSIIELRAYSRPSTVYRTARTAEVSASGVVEFMVLPGTNTRLFAQCVGQARSASASVVINVRTAISLTVVRNGKRSYTFKGTILPRRAGQLISLYRVNRNGTRVLSAQVKTDASGVYSFNRRFTGSGVFGFVTRTGQNLTNAAGESNTPDSSTTGVGTPRRTAIF